VVKKTKKKQYPIGRGKPPKATMWVKGQSGNPKGRPKKKPPAFPELLRKELSKKIVIKEGCEELRITKETALIKSTINAALRGKASARRDLVKWMMYLTMFDDHPCEFDDDDGYADILAKIMA
jgi:hypothetical protein